MADDPIRRWTFEAYRTDKEEKPKSLPINIFGRLTRAENMRVYLQERYDNFVKSSSRSTNNAAIRYIPCEEVSEETMVAFNDAVSEAAAAIHGIQDVLDVLYEKESQDEKEKVFEGVMSHSKNAIDDDDRMAVMYQIGRMRIIGPITSAIKEAIGRFAGGETEVHVHLAPPSEGISKPVIAEIVDKSKWN